MSFARWSGWFFRRILGPIAAASIPILIAVYTYVTAEQSKLREQSYEIERARYEGLVDATDGLLIDSRDQVKTAEFVRQARMCSLYCPDQVVRAINSFTDANPTAARCGDHVCTPEDRLELYRAFVIAIRKHLFATYRDGLETTLRAEDIRVLRATEVQAR